jgi:hypothetical protein
MPFYRSSGMKATPEADAMAGGVTGRHERGKRGYEISQ